MSKKSLVWLALGSLVVFSGLAWIITELWGSQGLIDKLSGPSSIATQVILGMIMGLAWGVLARWLANLPIFQGVLQFFKGIIGPMRLSIGDIILISCCAGIGEELLFRGAIQPFLGIWITAVLFVAVHGYLNPFNRPLFLYGGFLTLAIASLGYATDLLGLVTAIVAHTVIDIILLMALSGTSEPVTPVDTAGEL